MTPYLLTYAVFVTLLSVAQTLRLRWYSKRFMATCDGCGAYKPADELDWEEGNVRYCGKCSDPWNKL